jgi:hypothetical protein
MTPNPGIEPDRITVVRGERLWDKMYSIGICPLLFESEWNELSIGYTLVCENLLAYTLQAGIELGDTIDELCGQPLLKIKNGKVSNQKLYECCSVLQQWRLIA